MKKIEQLITIWKRLGYSEGLLTFDPEGRIIPAKGILENKQYPYTGKFDLFEPGSKMEVLGYSCEVFAMQNRVNYASDFFPGPIEIEVPTLVIGQGFEKDEEGNMDYVMHIISENYFTEEESHLSHIVLKFPSKKFPISRQEMPKWARPWMPDFLLKRLVRKKEEMKSIASASIGKAKISYYAIPMLRQPIPASVDFQNKVESMQSGIWGALGKFAIMHWHHRGEAELETDGERLVLKTSEKAFVYGWENPKKAKQDATDYAYTFYTSTGLPIEDCIAHLVPSKMFETIIEIN